MFTAIERHLTRLVLALNAYAPVTTRPVACITARNWSQWRQQPCHGVLHNNTL
jgi:hypothetical protein